MYIMLVNIHVKHIVVDDFIRATTENARNSIQEPGILRFDFIQQEDDPTRFMLVEVYRHPDDHAKHRETSHYKAWKVLADEMVAEPRVGTKYTNVFPPDQDWKE
jgi:(4S)-4-hydroxy-5-phosphonooxypentane-2,3-dione isomerase